MNGPLFLSLCLTAAVSCAACFIVGIVAGCMHVPNAFTPELGKLFIVAVTLPCLGTAVYLHDISK